jgi:hypothetical protein
MLSKPLALASMLSSALAGPLSLIHSRSTLPDVTIKALPAGCASYPSYDASSQAAGPWTLTVSDAENPDLVGFGPSTSYALAVGEQGPVMVRGYVRPSLHMHLKTCTCVHGNEKNSNRK